MKGEKAVGSDLARQQHFAGWVGGPVAHGQDVDGQVDGAGGVHVLLVLLEGQHDVLGQLHVLEHALQLAGEAPATLCPQTHTSPSPRLQSVIDLWIYLLKAYSPVNRTGSPQGL